MHQIVGATAAVPPHHVCELVDECVPDLVILPEAPEVIGPKPQPDLLPPVHIQPQHTHRADADLALWWQLTEGAH